MIPLLLLSSLFVYSEKDFSFGMIDGLCSDESVKAITEFTNQLKSQCSSDPSNEYCQGMIYYEYSNGKDLDSFMPKFPESTKELYLQVFNYGGEIDLSKLKNSKSVSIINNDDYGECLFDEMLNDFESVNNEQSKILSAKQKLLNQNQVHTKISLNQNHIKNKMISNTLVPSVKAMENSYQYTLQIVGDIKSKVPMLYLMYGNYKIVKSDLNAQNTVFSFMGIEKSDFKVKSDYFLHYHSLEEEAALDLTSEYIQAGEYTVLLEGLDMPIRIDCHEGFIKIFGKINEQFEDLGLSIPFDAMEKFGVISHSTDITINKADEEITQVKNVNFTILRNVRLPGTLEEVDDDENQEISILEKTKIKVTATGWGDSQLKPNVIFTFNKDLYEIDKTSAEDLKIEENYISGGNNDGGNNDGGNNDGGNNDGGKKSKTPMIIGISVAAGVVVIAVIVVIIVVVLQKKNKVGKNSSSE